MHQFGVRGEFSFAKKREKEEEIITGTQMTMYLKSNSINYLSKSNLMCFVKF